MTAASARPLRVMHVVTGGFSGATQVAVDLCAPGSRHDTLLVLRRKRSTDPARVAALRAHGVRVHVVPGWARAATLLALCALCRRWRPDVLVAHGFPEHLLGRWAGLAAGVPVLVQVEHNSRERYTPWRLAQARWLARHTARLIGVSESVRDSLLARGFPAARCIAIPNGIDLARFPNEGLLPVSARPPGVLMAARFSRQKDHLTLIRAIARLRDAGLALPLHLAGGGKAQDRAAAEAEVARLGLTDQVHFLGNVPDLPARMRAMPICVLATHYEGMPLALVEGMAAACACIASRVSGVEGVFDEGRSGLYVPAGDEAALAAAIAHVHGHAALADALGRAARAHAQAAYGLGLMRARYAELFDSLAAESGLTQHR